jgi:LysM repeat protein
MADLIRHVVRNGETISSIALRYGIQFSRIVQANGLKDASLIHAGQVLVIPSTR